MTIILGSGQNRVIKAMEIIKKYCAKRIRCEGCRFHYEGIDECVFQQKAPPEDWENVKEDSGDKRE